MTDPALNTLHPRVTATAIRASLDAFQDACYVLGASHQTVAARKAALTTVATYRLQAPLDVATLLAELAAADADRARRQADLEEMAAQLAEATEATRTALADVAPPASGETPTRGQS